MDKAIEKEAPLFWQALQQNLEAGMDSLPDDVMGSVTEFAGGIRVNLNPLGMAFKQAYTDLFYRRGATEIRCSALNGSPYTLKFCLTPENKLAVKTTLGLDAMDVDQASAYIVRLMLDTMNRK